MSIQVQIFVGINGQINLNRRTAPNKVNRLMLMGISGDVKEPKQPLI